MSELNKNEKVESHQEKIRCPNCGSIETATVKQTAPFWSYVHICTKCNNSILESEWDEIEELKEVKFNNNFPKLHNQTTARLVMVIQMISGYMLLNQFPDFTAWDTKIKDVLYYDIKPEENYMLILFVGNKNIMFSILRKQNKENVELFAESVGELFKITIEPTEGEKWALAKNQKIK